MCLHGYRETYQKRSHHLCIHRLPPRKRLRGGSESASAFANSFSTLTNLLSKSAVSIARNCKFMSAARPAATLGRTLPA